MKSAGALLLLLSALISTALFGCATQGQSFELGQARLQGKAVYDAHCAACHDAGDLHLIKEPPRLYGLFRKAALPSGAPANDAEVRKVILEGKGIMPPFRQSIDDESLNALMDYLHTL